MAVVHRTTLVPGKLELLSGWLPGQAWYASGDERQPELSRAGGFRLDDPAGEVGIEFMMVLDHAAGDAAAYLVPMTYRGSPLAGGQDALIGTSEHGVLGTRWIYDGARDPVLLTQLGELIQGRAEAQAQSQSNTPDLTVHCRQVPVAIGVPALSLDIAIVRVLVPASTCQAADPDSARRGQVSATWTSTDGTQVRGVIATATAVAGLRALPGSDLAEAGPGASELH
jgi:Maltokinase N-terminal cap domain